MFVALCVLAVGCKGKPTHEEPAAAETGSAPAPHQPTAAELALPPETGTPPLKTTKPIDKPIFDKLGALKFPGFNLRPFNNGERIVQRQETQTFPKLRAIIIIEPCKGTCDPMDLAKWKDKPSLKSNLAPALQQAKDTVFEVGKTDLEGAPMIFTYQLGMARDPASGGGAYSDMYILYYNDGVNQATVMAAYIDDPLPTKEALAKIAPKEDLEKVAKAFMDAYTHAWSS
ncbi:MAG TPA: hypothetical protein VMJ10_03420 [Kofleriaceae bacterium]|nr:hypothetical protein [Kofleriaceae bacterium]